MTDFGRQCPSLAQLWGYAAYQALARGVLTPADDNKIILFVTEEKQTAASMSRKDFLQSFRYCCEMAWTARPAIRTREWLSHLQALGRVTYKEARGAWLYLNC